MFLMSSHTQRRPIRVLTRPMTPTARIRDSRGIFELTKALKSADKALVVWTLRGWVAHNQAHRKGYRDGHYWTFNSLDRWQAKHFPWLTVKQLATLMTQLVKQGVVIRTRRSVHTCYWYRVNESALSSLCTSLPAVNVLRSQSAGLKDKTAEQPAQTSEHKTEGVKETNLKHEKLNQDTTTAAEVNVVVVNLENEAETECIEAHEAGHVKATVRHAQHDNRPISKVPLKVLSNLAQELIDFGVLPHTAQRLVGQHKEADIRRVVDYAREAKNLFNPPGFVVDTLDTGQSAALPVLSSHSLSTGGIEAWRIEALRRENERWAAEDAVAFATKRPTC